MFTGHSCAPTRPAWQKRKKCPKLLSRARTLAHRRLENGDAFFEPAQVRSRKWDGAFIVSRACGDFDCSSVFDMVNFLDFLPADPQTHKIDTRAQQKLCEAKANSSDFSSFQREEFPFSCCVHVDQAITARVIDDNRHV